MPPPPPPDEPPRPPPPSSSSSSQQQRTPSSSASSSSWNSLAQQEEAEAIATAAKLAQSHSKPFSTPANFQAPSLGEQFSYAARRHPYARLGYAAVFLTGAGVWWWATSSKAKEERKEAKEKE